MQLALDLHLYLPPASLCDTQMCFITFYIICQLHLDQWIGSHLMWSGHHESIFKYLNGQIELIKSHVGEHTQNAHTQAQNTHTPALRILQSSRFHEFISRWFEKKKEICGIKDFYLRLLWFVFILACVWPCRSERGESKRACEAEFV